jgi:hypothetical protein
VTATAVPSPPATIPLEMVLHLWDPRRPQPSVEAYRSPAPSTGWGDLSELLWAADYDDMTELMLDIRAAGMREPVVLGTDWRVIDGHRRLAVAMTVGLTVVRGVLQVPPPIPAWE